MCGIILSLHSDKSRRDMIVRHGLKTMEHRGETSNISILEEASIGHRRLAITDIHHQGHPYIMYDLYPETGRLSVWNVGEYYEGSDKADTVSLAKEWMSRRTHWSPVWIPGMYSALFYQDKFAKLTLSLDRLSKKPIYYRKDIQTYASEIKALTTYECGPLTLDPYYMAYSKSGRAPNRDRTPYNEIKRLVPAEYTITSDGPKIKHFPTQEVTEVDIRRMVHNAVMNRVPKEVPVANLLSGGLDSSIVHTILDKHSAIHSTPFFYKQASDPEAEIAIDYLDPWDLITVPENIDPIDDEYLLKLMYVNESPLDLGSLVPQYRLFESVSEHLPDVKVVITGDGADELFCGYKRALERNTQYQDLTELSSWHIPRLDKLGMWFGLEVRCPFMDDKFQHLSSQMSWKNKRDKKPLRRAASSLGLHDSIVHRKKHPLKSSQIWSNKSEHQKRLHDLFVKHYSTGLHDEHI